MAASRDISEQEFFGFLVQSKNNSAQSFRLISDSNGYYSIEERSQPFSKKNFRIKKHYLVILCAAGNPPCDIKMKFVSWRKEDK